MLAQHGNNYVTIMGELKQGGRLKQGKLGINDLIELQLDVRQDGIGHRLELFINIMLIIERMLLIRHWLGALRGDHIFDPAFVLVAGR